MQEAEAAIRVMLEKGGSAAPKKSNPFRLPGLQVFLGEEGGEEFPAGVDHV